MAVAGPRVILSVKSRRSPAKESGILRFARLTRGFSAVKRSRGHIAGLEHAEREQSPYSRRSRRDAVAAPVAHHQ